MFNLPRILGNNPRKYRHTFTLWYHSVGDWSPVQINKTAFPFLHSSPVDLLYADRVHSCIHVHFNIHPNLFKLFPYDPHTRTVPPDFHKPLVNKLDFPTFHYRTSSFCCFPLFSALDSPKILKKVNKISTGSEKLLNTLFFPVKENVFFWRQLHFFPQWNSIFLIHWKFPLMIKAPHKTFCSPLFF